MPPGMRDESAGEGCPPAASCTLRRSVQEARGRKEAGNGEGLY